ncbi:zinc alcohol dehydrogenase [Coniochaeta ligniaria NRRL 30616]|uniref:Zinc alcohol dehydrogenase n=1 Tax=Coniochaeta ligniaria NRRL 30616 TaxID=1408157 RepID=A0A1J7J2Y0_9PEZI|nr:zinc alcohol dehydrogenase [Coniochaeta ligniaria NRRL 30616]
MADDAQPPTTMKAWVAVRLGTPRRAMQLQPAWPVPPPPTGANILVRVAYAALNPADVGFLSFLSPLLPFRRTPVPGLDFSGTVVQAGPDVAGLGVGARVCGALSVGMVATNSGTLAEYIVVPEGLVAVVPRGMGMREAAGLGIVGQTAVIAHREAGGMGSGSSRVLVNGASGGLGAMVTQIAKGRGAWVVGVCSGGNGEFVRGLGADETIDYTAHEPLYEFLAQKHGDEQQQFDYVFDCVGHQVLYERSPAFLKPGGKYISLVGGKTHGVLPVLKNNLWPKFLWGTPRTYKILGLAPAGEYMREVAKLVEDGVIKKVPIDSEYSMEQAVEGYERVITKRARGKVVVKVAP